MFDRIVHACPWSRTEEFIEPGLTPRFIRSQLSNHSQRSGGNAEIRAENKILCRDESFADSTLAFNSFNKRLLRCKATLEKL